MGSVRPRKSITIQLVDVSIAQHSDELIKNVIDYARSEHVSDMLMTRAGHIMLWRADDAIGACNDLFTDMKRMRNLLKLDTDPIQLVAFDEKPELFLAYWYGGLQPLSPGEANKTDECKSDEYDACDYDYDYDMSLWFRKGTRIIDDNVVMELRRLANTPNTSPAKDTMIWSTPTSVWRPINVPPTRRYQIPCSSTGVVMLTVPDNMTVFTQKAEHFIFVNVSH